MKNVKKIFATLAAMLMVMGTCITTFAAEKEIIVYEEAIPSFDVKLPQNTDDNGEYVRFSNSLKRIGSDGTFSFSFSMAMDSSTFTPANSTINVYAKATSSSETQKTFSILLYRWDDDQLVGKAKTFTANDVEQYCTWSGLDTNTKYYLYFSKPSGGKITGTGYIKSIK